MITGLSKVIKIIGDTDKNNDNEGKNLLVVFSRKKERLEAITDNTFKELCCKGKQRKELHWWPHSGQEKFIFFNRGKIITCLYVDGNNPFERKWIKINFCRRDKG